MCCQPSGRIAAGALCQGVQSYQRCHCNATTVRCWTVRRVVDRNCSTVTAPPMDGLTAQGACRTHSTQHHHWRQVMAMGKGKKDKNNKKGSKDPAASEEAAYKKREEESAAAGVPTEIRPPRGGDPPPPGRWQVGQHVETLSHLPPSPIPTRLRTAWRELKRSHPPLPPHPPRQWTLNWDPVVLNDAGEATILVGSCPKTPADVRRLKEEAGVEAILSLQVRPCATQGLLQRPSYRPSAHCTLLRQHAAAWPELCFAA